MARVLIVLDGVFRFSQTDAAGNDTGGRLDFTYTTLVEALTAAGHTVTKAHRNRPESMGGIDTSPGVITSFSFNTGNLPDYDVIWLIGWDGRNAPDSIGTSGSGIAAPEIAAIARFMKEGGGVFATGDHDSVGAEMCGHIPRIRAMRTWYGVFDSASPMLDTFPRNFPSLGTTPPGKTSAGTTRADTTQRSDNSRYGGNPALVWFENQSDMVPQQITPTSSPAHPILRRSGSDIRVYPDHMHEGNALGDVTALGMGFHYDYTQTLTFDGESFAEFRAIGPDRPIPQVIATGQSLAHTSSYAATNSVIESTTADVKTVNALSVYDGRDVGIGRIVTGSTFHHYIDINLTGDSSINDMTNPGSVTRAGIDAEKGHGFNDDPAVFADIKAVFNNITNWLARPPRRIQIILERSTFSEAEAMANPNFAGAILVIVDGLKPNQFPGVAGITSLAPAAFQAVWAPTIMPAGIPSTGINIVPTGVASDDPGLHDRVQRITFTYRVEVTAATAFLFTEDFRHVPVEVALTAPAVPGTITDSAQITLVRSANPFMLDLDGGNTTSWLSSDVRVFPVVAGAPGSGLVNEASRDDALAYLRGRLSTMTDTEFGLLSDDEAASALSPFDRTTVSLRKVYNFAIARVRLPATSPSAVDVRVFFRIFTSQTTAALTYNESPPGVPVAGYKKTPGITPIAMPGTNGAGTEWLSFPMFLSGRAAAPADQTDTGNVQPMSPGVPRFFGCLIDNNLSDPYLPPAPTPAGGMATSLPMLMMGEHQCIVAQIEYAGTPIPNGANPFTSDKLSQRNIALSPIANPGLDASRMALHTFEIEATPQPIGDGNPPDELLLEWHSEPPEGTEVRLEISTWDAVAVVELADRFYARHEMRALDAHTIAVPGGGVRYVPVPRSDRRQTGVIAVHFPLGVRKGQRFDLSVRQVTTRSRQADLPQPKTTKISRDEAARLLENRAGPEANAPAKPGVFDLGGNRVLITDLRVLDAEGDHALIVEHPDPETVRAAVRAAGRWRETIGAFQLGIPVLVKADMLAHHLRLLSVLRWRAEWLRPNSRWYETFIRYVELIAEKVRGLGGDPFSVPATPDGIIPLPGKGEDYAGCLGWLLLAIRRLIRAFERA